VTTNDVAARPPSLDFDVDDEFAHERLLAFLVEPYGSDKQRQFQAMRAAQMLDRAGDHSREWSNRLGHSPEQAEAARERYIGRLMTGLFRPAGGFGMIAKSAGEEAWEGRAKAMSSGAIVGAGRLLLIVATMHRFHRNLKASNNRALRVLEASAKRYGTPIPPERHLRYMWRDHAGVAPIFAAVLAGFEEATRRGQPPHAPLENVRRVLSWAGFANSL
jgi:hypothetical protein